MRSRGSPPRDSAVSGIGVSAASATSTDETPLRNSHPPIAYPTASRSRIPLLFAKIRDVGLAESTSSERLKDFIDERRTLAHVANDLKVRFQKAGYESRAVKIENDALIGKFSVLRAELRRERGKRESSGSSAGPFSLP